uniref:Uncharacterized protein n=1 Tax=Rhizophora mucronata TaxID=61149 RepID=A0A2P2M449_RHIMU
MQAGTTWLEKSYSSMRLINFLKD